MEILNRIVDESRFVALGFFEVPSGKAYEVCFPAMTNLVLSNEINSMLSSKHALPSQPLQHIGRPTLASSSADFCGRQQAFVNVAKRDSSNDYHVVTDGNMAKAYKVANRPAIVFVRKFDEPRVRPKNFLDLVLDVVACA
jgi:hypothetical protein